MAAPPGQDGQTPPHVLFFVVLLGGAAVFGARPIISYRALDLGASNAEIGLIASAFALFALVGAIPIGRLVDAIGGRPIVMAGGMTIGLTLGLQTFADSLVVLGLGQAALGLGQLMLVIGAQTVLTNTSQASERDRRIGTYYVATALGQAIGPIVAGFVIGSSGIAVGGPRVLAIGSLVAFVAGILAATLPRSHRSVAHGAAVERRSTILETLQRSGMRQAIVSSIVLLTALDLILAYLPVYGEERGIAPQTIGIAIGVLGLSQMVSRLGIARLTARAGYTPVLLASMIVPAILTTLLIFPVGDVLLVGIMALIGLSLGLGQPLTLILVALASSQRSRGQAMSLRMVGNRLGQLVLPASVGATAGQAGVVGILIAVAALLGIGSVWIGIDRPDVADQVTGDGLDV